VDWFCCWIDFPRVFWSTLVVPSFSLSLSPPPLALFRFPWNLSRLSTHPSSSVSLASMSADYHSLGFSHLNSGVGVFLFLILFPANNYNYRYKNKWKSRWKSKWKSRWKSRWKYLLGVLLFSNSSVVLGQGPRNITYNNNNNNNNNIYRISNNNNIHRFCNNNNNNKLKCNHNFKV